MTFGKISTDMQPHIEQATDELLKCCQILVQHKLDSCPFGNVSIRIAKTEMYVQNPVGIHFKNLTKADVLVVNADGKVVSGKHQPHPGEFIHREIYRIRPDVNAIVHTHSHTTVILSLLQCFIEPLTQIGASFHNDQALYAGFTGPVRTSDEGKEMAHRLGDKSLLIAKNHGVFAAGQNIQSACWDFVLADQAARIHLDAAALGIHKADILTDEFLLKSKKEVRDLQCEAFWKQNTSFHFKQNDLDHDTHHDKT